MAHEGLLIAIGAKKKPESSSGGMPPSVREQMMGSGRSSAPPPMQDLATKPEAGSYAENEFKCPVCGAGLCAKTSDQGEPELGGKDILPEAGQGQ